MLSNINSGALRGGCLLIIQDEGHVDCVALHEVRHEVVIESFIVSEEGYSLGDGEAGVHVSGVHEVLELGHQGSVISEFAVVVDVKSATAVGDIPHEYPQGVKCSLPLFVEDSLDGLELGLLDGFSFHVVDETKRVSEHAVLGELVDRIGPGIPHSNAYEGKGFAGMWEYVLPLREMMKGDSLVFSFIFSVMIVEAIEGM